MRNYVIQITAFSLCLTVSVSSVLSQGTLGQMKHETGGNFSWPAASPSSNASGGGAPPVAPAPSPSGPEPPRTPHGQTGYSFGKDEDDGENELFGFAALLALLGTGVAATAPFWGPRALVHDKDLQPGYFQRYPYRIQQTGYLTNPEKSESYDWLSRGRLEYGDNFDDLSHFGGQILMDSASRFGMDSEIYYRREELAAGGTDSLFNGDVNVLFRFTQSPKLQMRTGLGMNWINSDSGSDLGFNFTYSGDWFPIKPLILSSEIDWGLLGDVDLFHGRSTIGVHYHRFELFGGFDYTDIGSTQIGSFISGVRLWY